MQLDSYALQTTLDGAKLFGWLAGAPNVNYNYPIALFDTRYGAQSGVVDPTNAYDSSLGFRVGQQYVNTATGNVFTAISVAPGTAVWRHVPRCLASFGGLAGSGLVVPNDVTEDILATVNIPAGAIGLNGGLQITTLLSYVASTNFKTLRIRLGGIGGAIFCAIGINTAGVVAYTDQRTIWNRGLANSQIAFQTSSGSYGSSVGVNATGAIDTTLAQTLVFTGQKAVNTDTMTLEAYSVVLTRPDIT